MADKDILADAREAFDCAQDAESENRKQFIDDVSFARLGQQWPTKLVQDRQTEDRPCLTINRLPSFIRQVVNDARQNKPAIQVHPADSNADPETAKVYSGLIRNIEYASSADVAYDTATENAVTGGFGYIAVDMDYAHDDTFDLDLKIRRIADPLTVYGDPASMEADSSDWNTAFEVVTMTTDEFERDYPDAEKVDWETDFKEIGEPWLKDDSVMVAKWWQREEVPRTIVLLSNGEAMDADALAQAKDYLSTIGITVVKSREVRSWKVTRTLMTGAEILKTEDWPGRFIPIIPVYGDEVILEGKRHFRSLIRDAKDPQRMFNYWRTTTTELVALAPKAPWVGPKGFAKTDIAKWNTANTVNHSFIEYDGNQAPERQPFSGVPAGALQEALNASDDMKSIMGIFDASLGARSNETSGRAILARQREGDVSTFHFQDNMSRAIRHCGRILIDLIPHVYTQGRIIRVLGEDNTPAQVPLGQPVPVMGPNNQPQPVMAPNGQPMVDQMGQPVQQTKVYDLGTGKYDLTVTSGPSYTTRRQEAADQMINLIQAYPQAAPVIGDLLAKNLDWPGADEIADRLKALYQQTVGAGQGVPPQQMKALVQKFQQLQQENAQLQQQVAQLKGDQSIDIGKLQVDAYRAQTDRMELGTETAAAQAQQVQHEARQQTAPDHTGRLIDMLGSVLASREMGEAGGTPEGGGGLLAAIMQSAQMNAQSAQMMAQAAERIAAPKHVRFTRDKAGKMTGAETVQ